MCEELNQCIDKYRRQILQVFGSDLVWTGCCTHLYLQNGVSDFGREDIGNNISILRNLVCGQVDVADKEIRVEVMNNPLHCPSGRCDRSIRMSEGSHLGLVAGEGQLSVANIFPSFCHIALIA